MGLVTSHTYNLTTAALVLNNPFAVFYGLCVFVVERLVLLKLLIVTPIITRDHALSLVKCLY